MLFLVNKTYFKDGMRKIKLFVCIFFYFSHFILVILVIAITGGYYPNVRNYAIVTPNLLNIWL
jgi:uncharacterized membrane protein (DUF106 family)